MTTAPPDADQIEYERPPLYAKQRRAIFNDARYAYIEASTKSGKTHGCLAWLIEQAILGPGAGARYWWIAPVYSQTKIAWQRCRDSLAGWERYTQIWESGIPRVVMPNGAIIEFRSGEKPDNLYGEDVHAVVLDEVTRMRPAVFTAIRSTLTATRGSMRLIGNVKGSRNWAYKRARDAEARMGAGDTRYHYAKITAYDAVAGGVLAAEEIADAKDTLSEEDFNELYLAEAASTLGYIYAGFGPANVTSAAEYVPDAGPMFLFYDWGFSDNTVILFAQIRDGALYVFQELMGNQRSEAEWVEEAIWRVLALDGYEGPDRDEWRRIWADQARPRTWPSVWPEAAIGDPSAPQMRTTFANYGVSGYLPKRVKHEVEAGQRKLNGLFQAAAGYHRLFLHPRCAETINALGNYIAKQREDGSWEERPDVSAENHVWSHPCDALRYGAWGLRRFFDAAPGRPPAEDSA